MRQFSKILGFVAVSFVLVFISKVNKTGLFTAYVKTIADVEIRNSQAIKFGDAALVAPVTTIAQPSKLAVHHGAALAALLVENQIQIPVYASESQIQPISNEEIMPLGMRAKTQFAPRAPNA